MKKVILLTLLIPYISFGQVTENFESGTIVDWVQNIEGRWDADTTESISGSFSLHHCYDNTVSGSDQAGIAINDLHPDKGTAKWTFSIRYGYDPSSTNNWSVFLLSDAPPNEMGFNGTTNGYAIGVNMTGYDDTLRLCKIYGNTITPVVSCMLNWQTSVGISQPATIVVERSIDGRWKVEIYNKTGVLFAENTGVNSDLPDIKWFGILYRYTSTRDRLLWFDDLKIEGVFYTDDKAPVLTAFNTSGKNSVVLKFDEEVDSLTLVRENFSLNQMENRSLSIKKLSGTVGEVQFKEQMNNKIENKLYIGKLCDKNGNCEEKVVVPFTPLWPETGDVIISEIMADPSPVVSLVPEEYVEITNRTAFSFNLKNWIFKNGNTLSVFPDFVIGPSEYIIVCSHGDTSLFKKYGRTAGIKSFPSLTDESGTLSLFDESGAFIHGVGYSSGWYGNELKSGGGWSLEMVDCSYPFHSDQNWKASVSRTGGTPGYANSVSGSNPDYSFKGIQNAFPEDSLHLIVSFTEPVFNLASEDISLGERKVVSLIPVDDLSKKYCLKPENAFLRNEIYSLKIESFTDFSGNMPEKKSFDFGLPGECKAGDLLFNEILFNPMPGDPDYIEFYNNSATVIDGSRVQVVSISISTGDTSQVYSLSDESICIMPNSYYAITTDCRKITDRYFSAKEEHLFEKETLPSMSDDKGILILYNRELDLIDRVHYDSKMHHSLLADVEGVALEKSGPRNNSDEAINWHSASEAAGWGTPGSPNSNFVELPAVVDNIIFSSRRITPDNDGFEDVLNIGFNLQGNGNIVSVTVFDDSGNYVEKLAENMLVGTEGTLIWDGTRKDGSPVQTGIYILLVELYNEAGKTGKWKKVCTVIRK